MELPKECRFTKEHEWVRVEDGVAVVGITAFAQQELGEIVYAELPAVGREVQQGDSLCVLESTKAASDVYAPLAGCVKEVNSKLSDEPNLINSQPYTDGWLVRLDGVASSDVERLMTAAEYEKHLS